MVELLGVTWEPPALGRGLAPGLSTMDPCSSPDPDSTVTLDGVEPLDLGGRGNSVAGGFGDDVVPNLPCEIRCMTLGRRRGGVAAPGKIVGTGGGKKLYDVGPLEMVEARTRFAWFIAEGVRCISTDVVLLSAWGIDFAELAKDDRADRSGGSLRKSPSSSCNPSSVGCARPATGDRARAPTGETISEDEDDDGRIRTPPVQSS